MKIGDFQSLLQFFAAIYLVAEWVSLERIVMHYKKMHLGELRHRIFRVKKYCKDLDGIWNDYTNEESSLISTYDLNKNYSVFRRICFIYFIICFIGLILSSFFGEYKLNVWVLLLGLIVLCIPFFYVVIGLILPVKKEFCKNKELIEELLLPLETAMEVFKENNSYPARRDAIKKRNEGNVYALDEYREKLKLYNERYDQHMRNSL
ncbi:hypothetical protein PVK62_17430 [Aliivibrio sp. S3MY1]|uniref:hypothetical protein n=1 Tax=unclassified Aliivibrio TaxID=2645654 RepID=UPI002378E4DA|nr:MULTISPECIES: hypothetical protein [unclassified Aliivibrio]MDD9197600.1 hypothetical protein [Aliivibrio sp. S3MY1]MDD9200851.1 hypothetical protein [Aliivibrio sp. S2MY1]